MSTISLDSPQAWWCKWTYLHFTIEKNKFQEDQWYTKSIRIKIFMWVTKFSMERKKVIISQSLVERKYAIDRNRHHLFILGVDEQHLFGDCTCNCTCTITSHLWCQIPFWKEFSSSFSCCSFRISNEYLSDFIMKTYTFTYHIFIHTKRTWWITTGIWDGIEELYFIDHFFTFSSLLMNEVKSWMNGLKCYIFSIY